MEITFVFFSSGYLDVSVRRVSSTCVVMCLQHTGLPHSEIFGSKVICTSPKLIAAYHVLRRLQEPRHSPYALLYFLQGSFKNLISYIFTFLSKLYSIMSKNFTSFSIFNFLFSIFFLIKNLKLKIKNSGIV
jgi:hypothetical protein